ncbi:MAG: bifunctional phosphoribosylaminoimidazolecarboxamide formyltransferase/IMP cyclohydrolase [Planctomycetota bacterium]|jgi:phosphoribosylaminoimidazolecarboxamide formyltransferase/IMP cyclohydrolase
MTKISRALMAPFDKTGIEEFARVLHERGVDLLATSGTAKRLRAAGLPVRQVAEHTGHPEILGGRVKTLHPKIHGGLLGRRDDPEHVAQMQAHGIPPIDLLCLNLYPFVETIRKPGVTLPEAIEQIDIGGPAMLRAAAKNHAHVIPLIDSEDYEEFLRRMDADELDPDYRRGLAVKAYRHTCLYDAAITGYLSAGTEELLPEVFTLLGERVRELRYGENPHQTAALYRTGDEPGLAGAELLNGKPLSFNNLQDAAGGLAAVAEFDEPAAVVVKHANPCGAAVAGSALDAFQGAWDGDPVSAFGGILAFNREVDVEVAEAIVEPGRFLEVILAPSFADRALEVLCTKPKWGKTVRILACSMEIPASLEVRSIPGGLLVQEQDNKRTEETDLNIVTQRAPNEAETRDLVFAQRVCKHVKSNAIVLVKDCKVVGVGAGQMSRVDAARIAVRKAGGRAEGAVFASDAFLPFNDALEVALDAGATAAVQPGGSRNDSRCIEFANERGIAMAFTGTRHFLH